MYAASNAKLAKPLYYMNFFFNPVPKLNKKVRANLFQQDCQCYQNQMMKTIIQNKTQYLKLVTAILINGIPDNTLQTEIIIDDKLSENKCVPIKVQDYLLSTEWCHGFKSTVSKG